MKKKLDKASVHNGRANSKGIAYNANHNTLELSRSHQPHIDPDRIHLNSYIQYLDGGAAEGCYLFSGAWSVCRKNHCQKHPCIFESTGRLHRKTDFRGLLSGKYSRSNRGYWRGNRQPHPAAYPQYSLQPGANSGTLQKDRKNHSGS